MAKHEHPLVTTTHQTLAPAMAAFPLDVIGILREAIKIPSRNSKFFLQVTVVIFLPFSLVVLLHDLFAAPLIHKVEEGYENSNLDQRDVRALIGLELVFFTAFCIVSLFGMLLTIQASASTYIGKKINLKDLMKWIQVSWKNPVITWLHVAIFTATYVVLVKVTIKLLNVITTHNLWSWVVVILAATFSVYLAAKWILALVISVMEDGSCGVTALERAERLIGGRKIEGFFLMLILVLLNAPIWIFFYVTATDDDDELGAFTQVVFGFVATLLFCLSKFFTFVVFTVLFYVCKQSHGEIDMDSGPEYILVPF